MKSSWNLYFKHKWHGFLRVGRLSLLCKNLLSEVTLLISVERQQKGQWVWTDMSQNISGVLQSTQSPHLILTQHQNTHHISNFLQASDLISLFIAWDEMARRTKRAQLLFLLMCWILKRLQKLCASVLTFRIGRVLPAAGAGRHQAAAGLVLRGFVGFGGHHELLTSQTRCGWSSAVLQSFIKLNCWEKRIQWDDRGTVLRKPACLRALHTVCGTFVIV